MWYLNTFNDLYSFYLSFMQMQFSDFSCRIIMDSLAESVAVCVLQQARREAVAAHVVWQKKKK